MKAIKKVKKIYGSLSVFGKASILGFIFNLLNRSLNVITSPIYTRLLTTEEYGAVTVFLSVEQLLGTVAMFNLSAGCFDVAMQDYKNDRKRLTFSLLLLSNVITLVFGLFVFLLYPYVAGLLGVNKTLMVTMFINFLLQPSFVFWSRVERFEYRYKLSGILTVISSAVSSAVAILAILAFPAHHVEARIIGLYVPMAVLNIIFWIYLGIQAGFKVNFSYWKFAFFFNLPLLPHYLSLYFLNSSDRVMINYMVGKTQAGFYGLAATVSMIGTMVWSSINLAISPYCLDKYEKKQYKSISDTVLPLLAVYACCCMLIILLAPEVLAILAPSPYQEAVFVIPPLIGSIFFQALYNVFSGALYYYKQPKWVLYGSLSTGILNILLNYIFIKQFGYLAAGYTTLVCHLLQALFDYFLANKVVGQEIYERKPLIKLVFTVLGISLISNILYFSSVARYIVLAMLLVAVYVKRNWILGAFTRK